MKTLNLIKVGGSLLDWSELPPRLRAFLDEELGRRDGSRVALIVGGGGAADFIRAMDRIHVLGDDAAHRLAIRAMDLTAHVLRTLLPGSSIVSGRDALQAAWDRREVPILSPRGFLEELDDGRPDALPASWDVTSDSIAARIAERLGASRLVLLKSVDLPEGMNRAEASRLGLVDAMFPLVARSLDQLEWVSIRAQPIVPRILGS